MRPTEAGAATVAFVGQRLAAVTAPGDQLDDVVRYDAGRGEANHLTVMRGRGPTGLPTIEFDDPSVNIAAGARCSPAGPGRASCESPVAGVLAVSTGDGDDTVRLGGPLASRTVISGGEGNDVLRGGGESDHLFG